MQLLHSVGDLDEGVFLDAFPVKEAATRMMAQQIVAEAAVKATVAVAVFVAQMDKRLRLQGILRVEPASPPAGGLAVALSVEEHKHIGCLLPHFDVAADTRMGVIEWSGYIIINNSLLATERVRGMTRSSPMSPNP